MERNSSLKLVARYGLDNVTLLSVISMQVCHNDQPFCHGIGGDNQQRNVGGNRVIFGESPYRSESLLPR